MDSKGAKHRDDGGGQIDQTSPRLADALRAETQPFDRIPLIDIGPLVAGKDPTEVVDQIRWALTNVGFLYVKNHGVAPELVKAAFDQTERYFALPLEDKMGAHIAKSGSALRGYTEYFGENTDPENTKDLKESLDLGPERSQPTTPFFGPNPWPAIADFREVLTTYSEVMTTLARRLLEAIALSLDLSVDHFNERSRDPIIIQRIVHYPPQTGTIDPSTIGVGAHSDYGSVTILAQDDNGGLQVHDRNNAWVEAPPIPDTFVVNIGDLVQRVSNNRYVAALHRVVNTSGNERYAIPYFFDADFDAVIEPAPSLVPPGTAPAFPAVTCGEHKISRFLDSFPHLGVRSVV